MCNNRQVASSGVQSPFWEMLPKEIIALTVAALMPALAFTVLLFFYLTIGPVFDPTIENVGEFVSAVRDGIIVTLAYGFAALIFASIYVGVLGFPASIIGWRLGLIRWWSSTIVGIFLGCLPLLLLQLSRGKGSSSWAGEIPLEINGVLTQAGWIDFVQQLLLIGFLGAVGGFAFWLVWRFWDRLTRIKGSNAIH